MNTQIIKLGDSGIKNCDIYKKFGLSASTVATVPMENLGFLR
jgi:hypothetical protein